MARLRLPKTRNGRIALAAVVVVFLAIGAAQSNSTTKTASAVTATPAARSTATPAARSTASSSAVVTTPTTSTPTLAVTKVQATLATTHAQPATRPSTSATVSSAAPAANTEYQAATARCTGTAGPDVVEWALFPGSAAEGSIDADSLYPNPLDPTGPCLTAVDVFFSDKNPAPGTCLEVAYASDNPGYDVNYTNAAAKPKKPFRKAGDSC